MVRFLRNGKIKFKGQNLLGFSPEERAYLGLFLGFQYPLEINGVTNQDFLRLAYNSKLKSNNKNEIEITSIDILNESQQVYNIIVNKEHLYFANNILTHNKPIFPSNPPGQIP
jgi:Fe-S cluster assembly ATPase SufC